MSITPGSAGLYEVDSPSGGTHTVMGDGERDSYLALSNRYQTEFKFQNVSDLADLDRLIAMEVMIWRWQQWISQEADYDGGSPDLVELKKNIKEMGQEVRLLKKGLGMDRVSRSKDAQGNVVDYIENLKRRAKEFGVTRNNMAVKSITLFKEMDALVTLYDNTLEDERRDLHCDLPDIINWFREVARPEFNLIDEALVDQQRFWIREL